VRVRKAALHDACKGLSIPSGAAAPSLVSGVRVVSAGRGRKIALSPNPEHCHARGARLRVAKANLSCFDSGMEPNDSNAKEGANSSNDSDAKERMNNYVAITVAFLASFMAITKVTDDNVCQAMERIKAEEVNAWALYQSKSIKQNLAELGREDLAALARTTTPEVRDQINAQVARYDKEIERYNKEKAEIKTEAEGHKATYQALNFRDDQFDLSDATLSIALGMMAVTALTGKKSLLFASWAIGGVGALIGLAGLMKLKIDVGWIVKLLS
jgi:hypothetical protein